MFNGAYHGKKVLITGHTGFKGSWLAAWLLKLGCRVTGVSLNPPSEPSHYGTLDLENQINDLRADIRNRDQLISIFKSEQPEIVFHLAAQALVRRSYQEPTETIETNAMGTLNVLEAIRQTPSVACAVLITSDKCYRNDEWVFGYRETDHLGGNDPYSASKGCAELIAKSYFQSYFAKQGPACATVRAGNVIGGGDWAQDRIVPDCARAFAEGKPVLIRNPHATRPWQHVLEPLSGYLWLGALLLDTQKNAQLRGEAYNFGPAQDVLCSVAEVVKGLGVHWPGFSSSFEEDRSGMQESRLLKLCCDKALFDLQWKATLTFEETIRATAEWYHRYYRGFAPQEKRDMLSFTLGQIDAYVHAAEQRGQVWVH